MIIEARTKVNRRKTRANKKASAKKKFFKLGVICIGIIFFILAVFINIFVNKYNNLIYPNIFIEDLNVGKKTKEDAIKMLQKKYNKENMKKNIIVNINNTKYTLNFSKLNIQYNFQEMVDKAFALEKSENVIGKFKAIKFPKKQEFSLKYKYEPSVIEKMIEKIEEDNNKNPINASIIKTGAEEFVVKSGKEGLKVDVDDIKKQIDKNMNIRFKDDIVINANMKVIQPKITSKDLENINSRISTFTTNYTTSNDSRSANIEIASSSIDGQVVMPGDTFSFNDVVGRRTSAKGYKKAKVIVGNKFVDDFGGGVCQVSTTLYNAILRANIMPTERSHHSFPSTYVGLGMDATVDYGNIDYKFKNTLDYPIYIEAINEGKNLTFSVYSNSSLKNRTYDVVNEVSGSKIRVYMITYENGKQISKKLISTDIYKKK